MRPITLLALTTLIAFGSGCATSHKTNTARTASEQILISSAVDRAVNEVQFGDLENRSVYLDGQYMDAVDKGYVISALRHRVLQNGGVLAAQPDEADVVLEVRSGGVGTDSQETFFGVPAIAAPGMPLAIPELKIVTRSTQFGTAKIGLVAYDPRTGRAVGEGGETLARTDDDNWYVLGIGPFRRGALNEEVSSAPGVETLSESIAKSLGAPRQASKPTPKVSLIDRYHYENQGLAQEDAIKEYAGAMQPVQYRR